MHKLLLFASFITLLMGACTSPPAQVTEAVDPRIVRLDSFMQANTSVGFSGSVLVLHDGDTLLDQGYGLRDREAQLPNTATTVHAIGSITKQFTATAILKLEDRALLSVHDSIGKYFADVPSDKQAVTLHQLLTHSAGFPGAIGDDRDTISAAAFLELAMNTPLQFVPGASYEYSNVGYGLLGIIVERVTGMGYITYLRDSLLVPCGLQHTGYDVPEAARLELAVGYTRGGARWGTMLEQPMAHDGPGWHLRANGGMLSSTHDMAAWIEALRSHKLLTKARTEALFDPYVEEGQGSGSFYGYGWVVMDTPRGTRLITHNGGNGIQFADVLWYPDEHTTIVLMSNASTRGMNDIAWELGRMLFDPDHAPQVAQAPQVLSGLPEGPVGQRLQAFVDIIAGPCEETILTTWFEANFGPGFLSDFPMERHLATFERFCADIGPNSIASVSQLGPEEYAVHLVSNATGKRFQLMVQLRPSDARISGIGMSEE